MVILWYYNGIIMVILWYYNGIIIEFAAVFWMVRG